MLLLANVLSLGLAVLNTCNRKYCLINFYTFLFSIWPKVEIWWRLYRPTATDYAQIWHVGVTRHVLFHPEFQHARYIIFHLAGKDRRDNRIF